jgi:hypothetical protein
VHIEQTYRKIVSDFRPFVLKKTLNTPMNTISSNPPISEGGEEVFAYTSLPDDISFTVKLLKKKKDDFKSRPYHVRLF